MICLTFDTDYMSQRDMERFLSEYPLPGKGTFFVTEHFPVLESTPHEICPHPFIHNLSTWKEEVAKIAGQLKHKPKGIRIHSCVFSHMIGLGLNTLGYTYVSHAQHLFQKGLKPYRHPWGIWELPIYYMDNMDFCISKNWPDIGHIPFSHDIIKAAVESESLYIFDIHPLHIVLNTHSHEAYCSVRERIFQEGLCPFELRLEKKGVGVFFEELCSYIESSSQRSYTCMEALDHFVCL